MGIVDADEQRRFAENYADIAVLTSDFDANDPYFAYLPEDATCRTAPNDLFENCVSWFGTKKDPKSTREFMVRKAKSDRLLLVPRGADDAATWVNRVHCCFPTVHSYEVRAAKQWVVRGANLLHNVKADSSGACVLNDEPRYAKLRARAFEISSLATACETKSADCAIGPVDPTEVKVCATKQANGGLLPSAFGPTGELPGVCLYQSLKGRFAIYRGQQPSKRDMVFKWGLSGGFSALSTTIATTTVGINVGPTDMVYSESLDAMVVIDGASGGVNLIGLTTFAPLGNPYL
jgi:hypothetical protein